LVVAGWYAVILLGSAGTQDRNFSFDVYTDPAYFSMWRTDMPGVVTQWPPPGEIGGVSVFTALLFVALGVALWLGLSRSVVVATACIFASAWLMRLFFAARMYSTGEVELWIRTDNELLYCGLVFIGLAVYLLAARLVEARAALSRPPGGEGSGAGGHGWRPGLPLRGPAVIGVFAGLLMLAGSMGSSQSDRYMPADVPSYKVFTYVSHTVRMLNGRCPQYAPHGQCSKDGDQNWKSFIYVGPKR
jgi:galactan 5-O-arabinofuranosyltransferase